MCPQLQYYEYDNVLLCTSSGEWYGSSRCDTGEKHLERISDGSTDDCRNSDFDHRGVYIPCTCADPAASSADQSHGGEYGRYLKDSGIQGAGTFCQYDPCAAREYFDGGEGAAGFYRECFA